MPLYVAIHAPRTPASPEVAPPADLLGLARAEHGARWVRTLTPDLHDDRHISLWEADSADEVRGQMERFHFFAEWDTSVFQAREWGPDEVIDAHRTE